VSGPPCGVPSSTGLWPADKVERWAIDRLSGFDLSLTGFGELELKDIMAERTAILGGRGGAGRAAPARARGVSLRRFE